MIDAVNSKSTTCLRHGGLLVEHFAFLGLLATGLLLWHKMQVPLLLVLIPAVMALAVFMGTL